MKIIDYLTVHEDGSRNFSSAVTERIKSGWQPLGAPVLKQGGWLCQAMVKYEEPVAVQKEDRGEFIKETLEPVQGESELGKKGFTYTVRPKDSPPTCCHIHGFRMFPSEGLLPRYMADKWEKYDIPFTYCPKCGEKLG